MINRGVARSSSAAFWLRLRIRDLGGPPTDSWVLSFHETRARHVTVFIHRADGEIARFYWNRLAGRETEPQRLRFPAFTLKA